MSKKFTRNNINENIGREDKKGYTLSSVICVQVISLILSFVVS